MRTYVSPLQSAEGPKDVNKVMARFAPSTPVPVPPLSPLATLVLACTRVLQTATPHACCARQSSGYAVEAWGGVRQGGGLSPPIQRCGPAFEPMDTAMLDPGDRPCARAIPHDDVVSLLKRLFACPAWQLSHRQVGTGMSDQFTIICGKRTGDGFCEVHVNTMEGFWSLLRSWRRPHRGISQEKLPLFLGFFEFVHNVRKRGKASLPALIELLVT
jgi:hypothetical protein